MTSPVPMDLSRNHPPMIGPLFDDIYKTAHDNVLTRTKPSDIIGHHRWMGTDRDRQGGVRFVQRRLPSVTDPQRIIVTNGTQSGLVMLFSGLVGQGGTLLTEDLTYPPLLTFARHFGLRIVGSALDEQGLIPEALEETVRREKPRALYAVPTYQNPTTAVMSPERRKAIAEIMRRHNVAIIEDDIYSLLGTDAPPPLSAYAPEISWHILGTAKSIAAGMKVGYVTAPSAKDAEKRFWPGVRGTHWMVTPIAAAVMTEMIENGGADRLIAAVRTETQERQKLSAGILGNIAFVSKPEALHLWFPLPSGLDRDALTDRVKSAGVLIGTSDQYVARGSAPKAVRIGIGNPKDLRELDWALNRFAETYRDMQA